MVFVHFIYKHLPVGDCVLVRDPLKRKSMKNSVKKKIVRFFPHRAPLCEAVIFRLLCEVIFWLCARLNLQWVWWISLSVSEGRLFKLNFWECRCKWRQSNLVRKWVMSENLSYVKVQFGSVVVNVLPQTRWDVTENLNTLTKIPGGKNVCESELGHLLFAWSLPVGIWVVAASLIAILNPRLDFATSFTQPFANTPDVHMINVKFWSLSPTKVISNTQKRQDVILFCSLPGLEGWAGYMRHTWGQKPCNGKKKSSTLCLTQLNLITSCF